ncbi:uncharacterized protein LOC111267970 [Varroa jacobsoni]|uniref:uncharacterized protein LOC111267970 n=1 Tax=Varroa jacobsoni TaxID=62625 RepID=UPI000BF61D68|nr:uncharacterized protein LOC111267970 [Varroa jacobsoni]XP_022702344.1 uncharacterized protein LOC111267970 [Varroa jacobsoni]XP_022702345.1 uncharacterized protein LOC111267970 [Varroa jacobsoni]XP_022702346.1 uncharacterized protein LOC111267970 [Varroa jacobsoni]
MMLPEDVLQPRNGIRRRQYYNESDTVDLKRTQRRLISLRGGTKLLVPDVQHKIELLQSEGHNPERIDAFLKFFQRALPHVISFSRFIYSSKWKAAKWVKWFFRHIAQYTDIENVEKLTIENEEHVEALTEFYNSKERVNDQAVGEIMDVFQAVVENNTFKWKSLNYRYQGRTIYIKDASEYSLYIYCERRALHIACLSLGESFCPKSSNWNWDTSGMPSAATLRRADSKTGESQYFSLVLEETSYEKGRYEIKLREPLKDISAEESVQVQYGVVIKVKWKKPTDDVCRYYQRCYEFASQKYSLRKLKTFVTQFIENHKGGDSSSSDFSNDDEPNEASQLKSRQKKTKGSDIHSVKNGKDIDSGDGNPGDTDVDGSSALTSSKKRKTKPSVTQFVKKKRKGDELPFYDQPDSACFDADYPYSTDNIESTEKSDVSTQTNP